MFNKALWGSVDPLTQQIYVKVLSCHENLCKKAEAIPKKNGKTVDLPFNCHSICRFISAHVSEVAVVDGYYLGLGTIGSYDSVAELLEITTCAHSWLTAPDGTIFDPYPVGMITLDPLVIPWNKEYRNYSYQLYRAQSGIVSDEMKRDAEAETNALLKFFPVPDSSTLQPA
jgi:hypothetical protein